MSVGFSASEYTVSEGEGSVNVCVTLQNGSIADTAELNLVITTQNGSAQGG